MDATLTSRLNNLIAASGGRIWINSGDRSSSDQQSLWDAAVAKYGPDQAANWVARPGTSNHEKGLAVDLGGDLTLAAQLAPRFGLKSPMSWEPWHFEMSDQPSDPNAQTNPPLGFVPPTTESATSSSKPDLGSIFQSLLGGPTQSDLFANTDPTLTAASTLTQPRPSISPSLSQSPAFTSQAGGPDGIDAFMAKERAVESSNNYTAEGIQTPYGTATGAYQFLDSTWGMYGGYASAKDAPPALQDAKARELMQQYYHQFGNWNDVAAAWLAGPNGDFSTNEVRGYVAKVNNA